MVLGIIETSYSIKQAAYFFFQPLVSGQPGAPGPSVQRRVVMAAKERVLSLVTILVTSRHGTLLFNNVFKHCIHLTL